MVDEEQFHLMTTEQVSEVITVSRVRPSHHQLHKEKGEMEELKRSISTFGLLHPIIVRPVESHFEVIAGNRRYEAVYTLGWKELKVGPEVKVVSADDKRAFEMALIENMARKDMDPREEGEAFYIYTTEHGWGSASELADKISKSPSHVSQRIDLFRNLTDDNFQRLKSAGMSVAHAVEVATSKMDNVQATEFTELVTKTGFDRDMTRKAIAYVEQGWTPRQAIQRTLDFPERSVPKEGSKRNPMEEAREDIENILSQTLNKLDERIREMPEGEERAQWTQLVRKPVHDLKSVAIRIHKEHRHG